MTDPIDVRQVQAEEIGSAELRVRAERARGIPVATCLVASIAGEETGFLSLDHRPDISCAVPYEIFVLPEFRKRGIGSALLTAAEALGATCGYVTCRVRIGAPDHEEQELVAWYEKRGYRPATDMAGEHEKALASPMAGPVINCKPCSPKAQECFIKALNTVMTGPVGMASMKQRLALAGLEIMRLQPQDITEQFRPQLMELQHALKPFPGPHGIVTTVEAMTRDDIALALGLIGVLGFVAEAWQLDRTQLNS